MVMGARRKVGAPRTGELKDHDDVNDAHSSLPHPVCECVCERESERDRETACVRERER